MKFFSYPQYLLLFWRTFPDVEDYDNGHRQLLNYSSQAGDSSLLPSESAWYDVLPLQCLCSLPDVLHISRILFQALFCWVFSSLWNYKILCTDCFLTGYNVSALIFCYDFSFPVMPVLQAGCIPDSMPCRLVSVFYSVDTACKSWIYSFHTSKKLRKKPEFSAIKKMIPAMICFLIAEDGIEPPSSRLWALRAANALLCQMPHLAAEEFFYLIICRL